MARDTLVRLVHELFTISNNAMKMIANFDSVIHSVIQKIPAPMYKFNVTALEDY